MGVWAPLINSKQIIGRYKGRTCCITLTALNIEVDGIQSLLCSAYGGNKFWSCMCVPWLLNILISN